LIFGRVRDIPKCLADYCDDRRFVDRKFSSRVNMQGNSRRRPTENGFANFTPSRFCRYFADDDSRLRVRRVSKRNVQIAIRFNSQIDNASVATLPPGTRGNLRTEAACRRFGSLTGFDD
jgi:hypothetical protein